MNSRPYEQGRAPFYSFCYKIRSAVLTLRIEPYNIDLSFLSFLFHHLHFRRVSPLLVFPDGKAHFRTPRHRLLQLLAVHKKLLAAFRYTDVAVAFVGKKKLYDAYGHESWKLV